MDKKKIVKIFIWILNILVILLLVWSLVNYKILNQEVGELVKIWGLIAMVLFIIVLEGAPVFVGSGLSVAAVLAMGTFNPWLIFFLFLGSALIGNVVYFYLGYFSGKRIFKYFDKKDVKRYQQLFKKYGRAAMFIMAISPLPYLPTLAGVFRVKSPYLIAETLVARMIRHTVVFTFWYLVLVSV